MILVESLFLNQVYFTWKFIMKNSRISTKNKNQNQLPSRESKIKQQSGFSCNFIDRSLKEERTSLKVALFIIWSQHISI